MKFESAALTDIGRVREQNQDAILEARPQGVFLVADGMGGEKAGEVASAQVIWTVQETLEAFFSAPPQSPSQVIDYLRDTLLQANMDVLQIAVREPEKRGLGSTASLLCLHRGVYFIAHVGDSRVYLLRQGELRQLTRDHTMVWTLFERGVITREQIETHPERHLLTQCIGSRRPVNVDLYEDAVQEGDVFLICSDGLTGMVDETDIRRILMDKRASIEEKGNILIRQALEAGGVDNVSAVLVRVTALEGIDDWTPDKLENMQSFEVTKEETIASEEPVKTTRQTNRMRILAPVILLLFVLAFALLKLGDFAPGKQEGAATLELRLPDAVAIQRLEVVPYRDGQAAGTVLVLNQADLKGKSVLRLEVQPELQQLVRVRALGQEDFVTSRQLRAGGTAVIEIEFPR